MAKIGQNFVFSKAKTRQNLNILRQRQYLVEISAFRRSKFVEIGHFELIFQPW